MNKEKINNEDKTLIMLINDVHHLFKHKSTEKAELIGISPAVNNVLFHLGRTEYLTQVDLVNKTHLRPSSISVTLQKMESDGLITREINPNDQRYIIVRITEKGRILERKIASTIRNLDLEITNEITEEEKEITKNAIIKIINKLMEEN